MRKLAMGDGKQRQGWLVGGIAGKDRFCALSVVLRVVLVLLLLLVSSPLLVGTAGRPDEP